MSERLSPVEFLAREIDSIRMWQTVIVGHLLTLDLGGLGLLITLMVRRSNGKNRVGASPAHEHHASIQRCIAASGPPPRCPFLDS